MIINQDTILKLVFRQGSENDRRKVIFTSGEPVYTTNSRRLFIGNGSLSGGDVVGNKFLGYDTTLATLATNKSLAVEGDLGFVIDSNKLYVLSGNNGSDVNSWKNIGGIYTTGDSYIDISSSNAIKLNTLSANTVSLDLLQSPLTLNSGRIALLPLSANYISSDLLQSPLTLNSGRIALLPLSANYISSDLLTGPIILTSGRIGLSSTIPYQSVSTKTVLVSSGLVSTANGVNTTGIAVNTLSSDIVIKSNQLYAKYNGLLSATSPEYGQNITTASRLSSGHYRFTFGPLPTANLIPNVQIFGTGALGYEARTISISNSSCDVKILSSNGTSTDANITLLISY